MTTTYLSHPLIDDKLTKMRKTTTNLRDFNLLLNEITLLAGYEVTKDLPTKQVEVETPLEKTMQNVLDTDIILVPLLRAGLGFLDGMKEILPQAKVGYIVMKRDEKPLEAKSFYENFPKNMDSATVIVLDPMLATGGSLDKALDHIKACGAKKIKYLSLLAAPEGIALIEKKHPDVDMYICKVDRQLNDVGYILPGLGDAGDRLFGTK